MKGLLLVGAACALLAAVVVVRPGNINGGFEALRNGTVLSRFIVSAARNDSDCSCEKDAEKEPGVGSCRLHGMVNDCCCEYETVNELNKKYLHPLVSQIVTTPYFKHFKVNLWCDCPLWPDDGMCALEACSVCECKDEEVPPPFKDAESKYSLGCNTSAIEQEFQVNRTVDPAIKEVLVNLPGWCGFNNPWMADDDKEVEYSYINLLVNPERYTGYKQGSNAQRCWSAIYSQSCFSGNPEEDECTEKRVFYRLISGLHSSITAHIAREYLVDEEKGIWGPNLDLFEHKLGRPELKSRVANLYFSFLFVLRAVMKTGPLLETIDYNTNSPDEDLQTADLMKRLVNNPALSSACPVPFDEGRLWKGDEGPELKLALQKSFQNITRIMDCVGCEKCKLWGKLQTLGLATALKVLFHESDCTVDAQKSGAPPLILERNEIIALINLLERLSQSLNTYELMSEMLEARNNGLDSEKIAST